MEHKNKVVVLDSEVTVRNDIGGNPASAFHPSNHVVLFGLGYAEGPIITWDPGDREVFDFRGVDVLVGQNIKFDLHWVRRHSSESAFRRLQLETSLYDTQLVEYIINGQKYNARFASLDDLAITYGGTLKPNNIKHYWQSGFDTTQIPRKELEEYLEGDVANTKLVMEGQLAKMDPEQLRLVVSSHKALKALEEIEWNGMKIEPTTLNNMLSGYQQANARIEQDISTLTTSTLGIPDFNPRSIPQVKALVWGGTIYKEQRQAVGTYKNGNTKYKNVEVPHVIKGVLEGKPYPARFVRGSVDEEVLEFAGKLNPIAQLIGQHRKVNKTLSVYLEGIKNLVYPDGHVHPNLHMTSTATGRLSSSEPNLQNIANSEVKDMFVSRHPNGMLMEIDFKQLEVVGLAHLSQCKDLMDDICNGVDIHFEIGRPIYGPNMSKEQRRNVKSVVFGLIYGGAARTLAEQSGLPIHVTKHIMELFYSKYPGVRKWHQDTYSEVLKNAEFLGEKTKNGKPAKESMLMSETGRKYHFVETDGWNGESSFSPTSIKNYPVQGLATADIVPMLLGELLTALKSNDRLWDKALLCNTIHDSIMLDLPEDLLEETLNVVRSVLDRAPRIYKETFGHEFTLPLKYEISVGNTWHQMESLADYQSNLKL